MRLRLIQSVPMAGTLPLRMFYTKRSCVSMRLLACYTHSMSHHLLVEVIHAQVLHGKTIFGLAALVVLGVAEPWCSPCGSTTRRGLSSSSISRLSLLLLLMLLLLFCFGRRTQSCSKTSSQAHTALALPNSSRHACTAGDWCARPLPYVARAGDVGSDTRRRTFFDDSGVQYACSLDERF